MTLFAILAQTVSVEAAETRVSGFVRFLLDNPFALALTFVFLVAIVGAFVAARKRDRCLKKFGRSPVTIREQGGRQIWGQLRVFSKGLELVYESPVERPAKKTFLLYEAELGRILAIHRFLDRLKERSAKQRARQARRLAQPPIYSRLWRWIRNIVNTFRDAIVQALGMSVQQASKSTPTSALSAQGGQIGALGTVLIGATANAYEPIIEQYIGDPVILELINPADPDKRLVEYHGYLGEYSAQFILLVDGRRRFQEKAPLDGSTSRFLEGALAVVLEGGVLRAENGSAVPIVVEGVQVGEVCYDLDRTVRPGETARVPIPAEAQTEGAVASISYERRFDLIVPRTCGAIRHASLAD
ncbi:MAG TPA: hypothetical protein VMY69_06030 [Phycisphaerae bacterium]|nr:hypothetical protein [Phycisphaerae bacterium]